MSGLGVIPGVIRRFDSSKGLIVPHIGWNQLDHKSTSPLLSGVPAGGYAYFVHSFYADVPSPDMILATTEYGIDFPAVVGRNNVYGAQFHPEKSQHTGLRLLTNFMEM